MFMESVHSIKKDVAGSPLRRPAAFFDVDQQGEGLTDVGTHLVDLVPWALFPEQGIDALTDLNLNSSKRWPTPIPLGDFSEMTGLTDFPDVLKPQVQSSVLHYCCNNTVAYRVRGIHVKLVIRWDVQTPTGADLHHAVFCGSRSTVEVRQGQEKGDQPQLYIRPNRMDDLPRLQRAVEQRCRTLNNRYRRLRVSNTGTELLIEIPNRYRTGHEAHFGQVTRQFLEYVLGRQQLPLWEKPNMLAKLRLTTAGVHLARGGT